MVSPLASSLPNPLSVQIEDVDEEHAETMPANFLKQLSPRSSHPVLHAVPSFESTSTARVPRDSTPTPGSSATRPFETSLRGIQASFDVFQMHNDPYVGKDGGVLDLPLRAIAGVHPNDDPCFILWGLPTKLEPPVRRKESPSRLRSPSDPTGSSSHPAFVAFLICSLLISYKCACFL